MYTTKFDLTQLCSLNSQTKGEFGRQTEGKIFLHKFSKQKIMYALVQRTVYFAVTNGIMKNKNGVSCSFF